MPVNEEVEEHVHHAHDPFDKTVAASMAIIAAFLAVVSVLGQHFTTEQLLMQQKASDEWAFSQAKDIRHYSAQIARDILPLIKPGAAALNRYTQDADRYKKDSREQQEKARDFEKERDKNGREAVRFHFGEVFLEVAIVLSSLSILMKRRALFLGGAGAAIVGVLVSATALTA